MTTPSIGTSPWHTPINNNFDLIDSVLATLIQGAGGTFVGAWLNNTGYLVDQIVSDFDGTLYKCLIAHTSAVAPTTFTADRTATPANWSTIDDRLTLASFFKKHIQVSAQASTNFDMVGVLDQSYAYDIFTVYESTGGSPAEFKINLLDDTSPITATYNWTYSSVAGTVNYNTTSASNYANLSYVTTANNHEIFSRIQLIFGTTNATGRYQTMGYNGSVAYLDEGVFSVPLAGVDGIRLYNVGTNINARASIVRRPML